MSTLAPSCYTKECGTWLTGEGSSLKRMENEAKKKNQYSVLLVKTYSGQIWLNKWGDKNKEENKSYGEKYH